MQSEMVKCAACVRVHYLGVGAEWFVCCGVEVKAMWKLVAILEWSAAVKLNTAREAKPSQS